MARNVKETRDLVNVYFWDIETSTLTMDDGEEMQVTYLNNLLCLNVLTGEVVFSHFERTIEEMVSFMNSISSEEKQIIVYSHNLHYELSHLLRAITPSSHKKKNGNVDVFNEIEEDIVFRSKTSPLAILLEEMPNVYFRDSYALFNKSVEELGKDLTKRTGIDYSKLDYDYSVERTPFGELEQLDYDYNERDNLIVAFSIFYYLQDHKLSMENIPLTFTAQSKKDRFEFIKANHGKMGLYSINKDKYDSLDDVNFYDMCDKLYQGGLTTAGRQFTKKFIEMPSTSGVYSCDIKSSYPYQTCNRRFPLYFKDCTAHFETSEANDYYYKYLDGIYYTDLTTYGNKNTVGVKGYMMKCKLKNVRVLSDKYLLPISIASLINPVNVEKVNGKLVSCDETIILLSHLSLSMLQLCYSYDDLEVLDLYVTFKDRHLRESEVHFLLHCFDIKESVDKDVEPLKYALSKVNLNTCSYGVKVQKPVRSSFHIRAGEVYEIKYHSLPDDSENGELTRQDVYNNFINLYHYQWENNQNCIRTSKNFDVFCDGIHITEYARLMLVEMSVYLTIQGFNICYCDTDSLKFIADENVHPRGKMNPEEYRKHLSDVLSQELDFVNNEIINGNAKHDRFDSYKEKYKPSAKVFEKMCKLGTWELENARDEEGYILPYPFFSTLGAKKYAYIDYKANHGVAVKDENGQYVQKIKTTIAGCSKKVSETITLFAHNQNIPYNLALRMVFRPGTQFDESCSGRTTAFMEDRPREYCKNLTYKGKVINQCGGVIIKDTTYTLDMTDDDFEYLFYDEYQTLQRDNNVERVLSSDGTLMLL